MALTANARAQNTKRILEELDIGETIVEYADISIDLEIPAELCVSLESTVDERLFKRIKRSRKRGANRIIYLEKNHFNSFKNSLKARSIKIEELIEIFIVLDCNQSLIDALPDKQIAMIEEYRMHIMHAVYNNIEHQGRPPAYIRTIEDDEGVKIFNFFNKHAPAVLVVTFSVLFVLGVTLDVIYSFSGFYEIAAFIPGLASTALIGTCAVLALLNLLLYVTFEGVMMGEMFGVGLRSGEKKKLDGWEAQLQLTKNIHERMTDQNIKAKMKAEGTHSTYQLFDNLCDRLIFRRQLMFKDEDCNESARAKAGRIIILIVGGLLSIGNACFSALSAVPLVMSCVPFLAVSWFPPVFIVAVVTLGLAYYLFAQRKTIMMVLSINLDKKQEIAKELNEYHDRQPLGKTMKQDLVANNVSPVALQANPIYGDIIELDSSCLNDNEASAVSCFTSGSYSL